MNVISETAMEHTPAAPAPRARRSRVRRLSMVAATVAMLSLGTLAVQPAAAAVPSSVQTTIASLAKAQSGKTASAGFSVNSIKSTSYPTEWCSIFAGWAWQNADPGVDVTGITAAAASFSTYGSSHGTSSSTAHVGDAVVFIDTGHSTILHVGIVTSISGGNIYTAEGNVTVKAGSVSQVYTAGHYGATVGSTGTGISKYGLLFKVAGYISPAPKMAPNTLAANLADYSTGQEMLNWSILYNPDSFTIYRNSTVIASGLSGSTRSYLDYAGRGMTLTYKVCAVKSGSSYCATVNSQTP